MPLIVELRKAVGAEEDRYGWYVESPALQLVEEEVEILTVIRNRKKKKLSKKKCKSNFRTQINRCDCEGKVYIYIR